MKVRTQGIFSNIPICRLSDMYFYLFFKSWLSFMSFQLLVMGTWVSLVQSETSHHFLHGLLLYFMAPRGFIVIDLVSADFSSVTTWRFVILREKSFNTISRLTAVRCVTDIHVPAETCDVQYFAKAHKWKLMSYHKTLAQFNLKSLNLCVSNWRNFLCWTKGKNFWQISFLTPSTNMEEVELMT